MGGGGGAVAMVAKGADVLLCWPECQSVKLLILLVPTTVPYTTHE